MKKIGSQVWEKINEKMKEKNITQYRLAKLSGVYINNISALKQGDNKQPSFALICKIADGLGVKVDELRPGKEK